MLEKLKREVLYSKVRLFYIVVVLLYSLARQFIVALQPVLMLSVFNLAVIGAAGLICLWDIICFRNIFKAKYIWILAVLFAFTLISTVLNIDYGFSDNIKAAANMFIQFFVLYVVASDYKKEDIDKDIKVIGNAVGVFWMIATFISLIMYFADIYYTQTNYLWGEAKLVHQGFVHFDGGARVMRLWGVFIDPNFASAVSIIIICICAYLLYLSTKKWQRILHIVNIVVQSFYIVLSGSRMALLIVLLLAAVGGWYFAGNILSAFKKTRLIKGFLREVLAVALAVISVGAVYTAHTTIKSALPYVRHGIALVHDVFEENTDLSEVPDKEDEYEINRDDMDSKTDISNGRLELWLEGFKVFKKSPVFGVGPRNYATVANEINSEMDISYRSVHNSYVELLMGNGVIGFMLMLLFFLLCAIKGLKFRNQPTNVNTKVGILLLIVLSALAGGMFISSLFYYLSGISVVAFVMIGYAMKLMECENKG